MRKKIQGDTLAFLLAGDVLPVKEARSITMQLCSALWVLHSMGAVHRDIKPENVILPGYITDGQAKSLMSKCRAFLFPTLYEGFGLPPLEAIASGANAIVISDIDVMHEVYGEAGTYIDPYDRQPLMPELNILGKEDKERLLGRFSWKETAEIILNSVQS